ncbi:hypothetical protein ASPFODRAFT_466252 [Aspergillus luchuensis CBS 106.47]|uniref:Uncharacterized protein n=1 Tax=Aspergillus luchuensis (strain CBS 106.47) TaxID=1137211 RepID=A0A1M3T038_ASPLC|nr:hypothetical protein ASPFODRAFT_466252 [Aspergillus luchuensis CBS 106.47]
MRKVLLRAEYSIGVSISINPLSRAYSKLGRFSSVRTDRISPQYRGKMADFFEGKNKYVYLLYQ